MSDLKEKAAALLARIDDREDVQRRGGSLSPDDRALILRLGAKGISQTEIAKVVGCHQATVSRTLALLDTRTEARMILESGAAKLAQTVVDTDDAAIALKALGKVDVVRDDAHGGGNNNVVLLIGQPGQPIPEGLEPPVIDVTPSLSDGNAA
jgi:ParB-like chromosome segregation protein Spo0J